MAIRSIFGQYADKLQVLVDNSQDKFAPTFFERYFDFGIPQTTLNFVTAIGRSRVDAAASIVDRDSLSPLRSRQGLEKLSGEVPAIKHKFKMTEGDVRDYLTLQSTNISDEAKKRQLLDLMFGDVRKAGNGIMKRLDYMVLEGLSTGVITVTADNNPDGVVAPTAIDLLMPAGNKTNAAVTWSTSATATPITDIMTAVDNGAAAGRSFGKILMSRAAFLKMAKTDEVKNYLAGFFRLGANGKNMFNATLDQTNEYLQANLFPTIEIVDSKIGIEKDGIVTNVSAFNESKVVLIPDGKLGRIHNAIPVEKLRPVPQVAYADYNGALISKWSENEPFSEWTKGEINAFPGFEAIDNISIITI